MYSASAAAIFIGCWVVMIRAVKSPVTATKMKETITVINPNRAVLRAIVTSRFLINKYAETPATNAPAVKKAAGIV